MFTLTYKNKVSDKSWKPVLVVKTISEAIEYLKANDYILDKIQKGDWLYMRGVVALNQYRKVYPMPNMIPDEARYIKISRLLDGGHEVDTANVLAKCLEAVKEVLEPGEILQMAELKILRGEVIRLTVDGGNVTELKLWLSNLEKQALLESGSDSAYYLLEEEK